MSLPPLPPVTLAPAYRARSLTFIAALLAVCASSSALAQVWPQHPIKVVIPFPPGSPNDLVMRTAAEKMLANLKQPILIESQPSDQIATGSTPVQTLAKVAKDFAKWGTVARKIGLSLD